MNAICTRPVESPADPASRQAVDVALLRELARGSVRLVPNAAGIVCIVYLNPLRVKARKGRS